MRRLWMVAAVAVVAATAATTASASPAVHGPRIKGFTGGESTNWSGYAVTGATPFTDVKGSWVEPSASCTTTSGSPAGTRHGNGNGHGGGGSSKGSQSSYAAFWVGLDGDISNTVEQTGTDSDCNGTTPVYYAWYEFYPAYPVNLSSSLYPVSPGDTLSGEVSVSAGIVTVSLHSSRGWTFDASQPDTSYALSSAEWIAEAPSSGNVLPLADFGTVNFSNASATGSGGSGTISAFSNEAITMVTKFGQPKAVPSGLTARGSAFSVTWEHS